MLQTLKNYSTQEAAVILAGVTRQLLPEELIEPTSYPTRIDSAMSQSVLAEVYKKLGLNVEDKSEKSQARVISYLGQEMSRAALAESDLPEVENRVGQQGNLRPDAYKVVLTNAKAKDLAVYDIGRSQVKQAVSEADDFQHLLPGLFGPTDSDVSLFVKEYENEGDPFTIVVQTRREGATLTISRAFKIYHSDVGLDPDLTPLGVLLAFVTIYGVNIRVGDEIVRFMLYKSIPHNEAPSGTNLFTIVEHLEEGTQTISGFHLMPTENTVEVAVGYMINETKYLADLRKHKSKGVE